MQKSFFLTISFYLLAIKLISVESIAKDSTSNPQRYQFELKPSTCLLCASVLLLSRGQESTLKREVEVTDSGIAIRYLNGDSGKQENLNWACKVMNGTEKLLLPRQEMEENLPLCPFCAKVFEMIKSGATLTANATMGECLASVIIPDSNAKSWGFNSKKILAGITEQMNNSENVGAVIAELSIASMWAGPRHFVDTSGVIFVYTSHFPTQVSKANKKLKKQPTVVNRVLPKYPPLAYSNRIEGNIAFSVLVGTNGQVIDEKILYRTNYFYGKVWSDTISAFDSKVLECLKMWTFKPAIRNGKPVESWYNDSLSFRIKGLK